MPGAAKLAAKMFAMTVTQGHYTKGQLQCCTLF